MFSTVSRCNPEHIKRKFTVVHMEDQENGAIIKHGMTKDLRTMMY